MSSSTNRAEWLPGAVGSSLGDSAEDPQFSFLVWGEGTRTTGSSWSPLPHLDVPIMAPALSPALPSTSAPGSGAAWGHEGRDAGGSCSHLPGGSLPPQGLCRQSLVLGAVCAFILCTRVAQNSADQPWCHHHPRHETRDHLDTEGREPGSQASKGIERLLLSHRHKNN